MNPDTFYYFAYGTYVDVAELKRSLASVGGAPAPAIKATYPALLPGYRLVCDAVSAEGPRLGRLNITPYSLAPRDSARSSLMRSRKNTDGKLCDYMAAFRDGVRGILYELPLGLRETLMRAVALEGSFNMYAMLTCYEMSHVERGTRSPDSHIHEALVIAAIDMPLLERKFLVEAPMKLRWQLLPKPQGVKAPPGLVSKAKPSMQVSRRANEDKDDSVATAAETRWPGLHWCNCINSSRVAPSVAYVALLEKAYREFLRVCMAADDDDNGGVASGTIQGSNDDVTSPKGADCASYRGALHRMIFQKVRDVDGDPQEAKTWYLAYGSNLSWEQVCIRIGPPYQRCAVKLADYVLVPNTVSASNASKGSFGYYNVEPVAVREQKQALGFVQQRSTMPTHVCGAAYEISMAQLAIMDTYELGYTRELLPCHDLRHHSAPPLQCWTYIAQHTSEDLLPSSEYIARVLEGSDILPLEYMEGIRATQTHPLRSPRQDKRLRKEI